ncbi:MAG: hypothetical protein HFE66_00845 [Clostridiales bacterium]|jgi:hypothetical protein|nr:hypothetical protein [Clostridiales bacterium]
MKLGEKSAYLQGLAAGLDLDQTKAEGKLIGELLTVVSDMAAAIEDLEQECARLNDYIEELDADLGDVEEILFDEEEDFDDDEDDCECDCCCGCDDIGQRMLMCANCGETICYDETLDPETLICPACGKSAAGEADAKDE